MSLEAIRYLSETEEKLRLMKAACAAESKKRIAEACSAGENALAEAEKKAERELDALYAASEEDAKYSARALASSSEEVKAEMRSAAEAKMAEAVSFIVERIVKS